MEIFGKNVLVTGASRGIGFAISTELAKEKANLILVARTSNSELESKMLELGAKSVLVIHADLSSFEGVEKLCKTIENRKIEVDILINNAGILTGGLLEEQDLLKVYEMLQVNLNAYIHLSAMLLPGMLKRGFGKIVNNASISGIINLPSVSTYTATKSGVVAFSRSLEQELVGTGVSTLLLITPGVETRLYKEVRRIYSMHMKISSRGTVEPEVWAKKVIKAIQSDKKELWPSGGTLLIAILYQVFPWLVKIGTSKIFKR